MSLGGDGFGIFAIPVHWVENGLLRDVKPHIVTNFGRLGVGFGWVGQNVSNLRYATKSGSLARAARDDSAGVGWLTAGGLGGWMGANKFIKP